MAANLISAGTTDASSSDIVLADGASLVLALKAATSGAVVYIDLKDDAGAYHSVGCLGATDPAKLVSGPGTYRARRVAGASCGVFSA